MKFMEHGKIVGILLIICVAITFLGAVSAAETVINGEKFNIPDKKKKNDELSSVSKASYGTDECAFYEKGDDGISITVSNLNGGAPNLPTDDGYEDKNIAGIDGKYREDPDGAEFVYVDGQMSVTIWLPNNCSVSFEDIIINEPSGGDSGSPFNLFG